jgi:hypothetical protein
MITCKATLCTCRATLSGSPVRLLATLVALVVFASSAHAGERYALIVTGALVL